MPQPGCLLTQASHRFCHVTGSRPALQVDSLPIAIYCNQLHKYCVVKYLQSKSLSLLFFLFSLSIYFSLHFDSIHNCCQVCLGTVLLGSDHLNQMDFLLEPKRYKNLWYLVLTINYRILYDINNQFEKQQVPTINKLLLP